MKKRSSGVTGVQELQKYLRISDLIFAHGYHWPCMQAKPEEKSVKEQMSHEGARRHWYLCLFEKGSRR
jgi:hypothetical protein